MKLDSRLVGSRLREAIMKNHSTLSEAVRKLQDAGVVGMSPERMSEYLSGVKVPTLERFSVMVMVLELDVTIIFPGWADHIGKGKVRGIRHPNQRQAGKPLMEVLKDEV